MVKSNNWYDRINGINRIGSERTAWFIIVASTSGLRKLTALIKKAKLQKSKKLFIKIEIA